MNEQEQADRLEWILRAHRENLTELSTAITDAQDRWLLCREVARLRAELDTLRALVAHLPMTADGERIVPGRKYWTKVDAEDIDPEDDSFRAGYLLITAREFDPRLGEEGSIVLLDCWDEEYSTMNNTGCDFFARHPETGEPANESEAGT